MSADQSGERALWRAVIQQAVADATRFYTASSDDRAKARRWFSNPSKDFNEVCAMADLDPEYVRAEALDYIAKYDAGQIAPKGRSGGGRISPTIEFNGESMTAVEWSKKLNIPAAIICYRLRRGYPAEDVLSTGRGKTASGVKRGGRPSKTISHDGLTLTVVEWSRRVGVPSAKITARLARGFPVEMALSTENLPRGRQAGAAKGGIGIPVISQH